VLARMRMCAILAWAGWVDGAEAHMGAGPSHSRRPCQQGEAGPGMPPSRPPARRRAATAFFAHGHAQGREVRPRCYCFPPSGAPSIPSVVGWAFRRRDHTGFPGRAWALIRALTTAALARHGADGGGGGRGGGCHRNRPGARPRRAGGAGQRTGIPRTRTPDVLLVRMSGGPQVGGGPAAAALGLDAHPPERRRTGPAAIPAAPVVRRSSGDGAGRLRGHQQPGAATSAL
jgi:hypothetical protein